MGQFLVKVSLTDGFIVLDYDITITIFDVQEEAVELGLSPDDEPPAEPKDAEDTASTDSEQDGNAGSSEATQYVWVVEQTTVEETKEVDPVELKHYEPPVAKVQFIQPNGEVLIYFSKDMHVIADLVGDIEKGTMKDPKTGKTLPVLDVKVVEGYLSDPKKLKFTWKVKEMQKRELRLQLYFETAMFVSSQEEPETLQVTFNDRQLFTSTNNVPLAYGKEADSKAESGDRRALQYSTTFID